MLKKFSGGEIDCTKLYHDGTQHFKHQSLVITSSNNIPNVILDSGIARRVKIYEFQNTFTEDKKLVNNSTIYFKDIGFFERFDKYRDAWVDILVSYAIKFVNNEKIQYTKSFESAKALLCNVNDIFQDFIDSKLQVEEGSFKNRKNRNARVV